VGSLVSLSLSNKNRIRLFENKLMRKILRPMRDEAKGSGEDYFAVIFIILLLKKYSLFG
jgi:hypothetical protein